MTEVRGSYGWLRNHEAAELKIGRILKRGGSLLKAVRLGFWLAWEYGYVREPKGYRSND